MTDKTIGRLWSRYLEGRGEHARAEENGLGCETRDRLERRARDLRDRIVLNYSPLVKYVVGRMASRATGAVDQQDFYSWGILGLLSAIETFDPERQTKFETYAISKIRWSILDEFRKEDWVPRRVRSRFQEIERSRGRLTQEMRRPPTNREIAEHLGVDPDEHLAFIGRYTYTNVGSLEATLESDDGISVELGTLVRDSAAPNPESEAERAETQTRLVEALKDLKEQERLVATFYFYEGLTLKEIGKAMNLTEGRISQVLRRALEKLRVVLTNSSTFYT